MISETRGGTARANALGQRCGWSIPEIAERPVCLEWRDGGTRGEKKCVEFLCSPFLVIRRLGLVLRKWSHCGVEQEIDKIRPSWLLGEEQRAGA